MRPRQIAGFIAAIMIAFCGDSSAIAQGTEQQRQACTPDVFRFCGAYIPDVDRITACLRGNGPRLSSLAMMCFSRPKRGSAAPVLKAALSA
jgi:hypothetical protein